MNGHVIHSMDINNAFLQTDLHKEVYTQPTGFVDPKQPHLKKALYRLKWAPFSWNHTLNAFLINISFTTTATDPCLYALHNHSEKNNSDQASYNPELHRIFVQGTHRKPLMIVSIYVDDLLMISLLNNIEAVKEKLQHFHSKEFGLVSTSLSINIIYNISASTLNISQQQKILDLATEFGLIGAKPLTCPAHLLQ